MTLKEIVTQNKKEEILEALYSMYPECKEQDEAYSSVLAFVESVVSYPFDEFVIRFGLVDPASDTDYEAGVDEEAYISISGYSEKENLEFALGFTRWEEWANAPIELEADLNIEPLDVAALCVYEMTFYGFDQETISEELKVLENGLSSTFLH